MLNRLLAVLLVLASSLAAAEPVATLTAGLGVSLNGRPLEAVGAPNWPVSAEDEIVTGPAAAVLAFPDGATFTLAPNTRVALQKCDRCVLQLFKGAVDYRMAAGSTHEFCALGRPVQPAAGARGAVMIEGPDQVLVKTGDEVQVVSAGACSCNSGAPWAATGMSAKAKVAIVAAAGAAATGATIAVTRPKSPKGKGKGKGLQ